MKTRRVSCLAGLVWVLALSSCATAPAPPMMDPALFEAEYARAQANPSAPAVDRDLGALLDRGDLGGDQRFAMLVLRAEKRALGQFDKPGALSDIEAALALRPLDPAAGGLDVKRDVLAVEIAAHQARLSGLQSLPAWFDDKVALGQIDEAAARQRASGLYPSDQQVYTLREAGYLCRADEGAPPLSTFAPEPDYAADLSWCPQPVEP